MNIVDQQTLHDVISYVGVTANIITTGGPAGRVGFTTSTICSVTDTPPILLVCLDRGASVWSAFNEDRTLCVNTLSARQEPLLDLSDGKTPMGHRSAAIRWQTGMTGRPQLKEALVSFDCRINRMVGTGIYGILSCAIEATHRHTTPYGLVWLDRSYHVLVRLTY